MKVQENPNCPNCKEGIGEMHTIYKQEVANGSMIFNEKFTPATEAGVHVTFDTAYRPIIGGRVPALRSFKDICEKCGAIWSVRTERGHVTYTGNPMMLFKGFQ